MHPPLLRPHSAFVHQFVVGTEQRNFTAAAYTRDLLPNLDGDGQEPARRGNPGLALRSTTRSRLWRQCRTLGPLVGIRMRPKGAVIAQPRAYDRAVTRSRDAGNRQESCKLFEDSGIRVAPFQDHGQKCHRLHA